MFFSPGKKETLTETTNYAQKEAELEDAFQPALPLPSSSVPDGIVPTGTSMASEGLANAAAKEPSSLQVTAGENDDSGKVHTDDKDDKDAKVTQTWNDEEGDKSDGEDVMFDSLNTVLGHIGRLDHEGLRTIRERPGESWSSKSGKKDEAWKKKWDSMQNDLADALVDSIDETHIRLIQSAVSPSKTSSAQHMPPSLGPVPPPPAIELPNSNTKDLSSPSSSTKTTESTKNSNDSQSKAGQNMQSAKSSWISKTGEKDAEWTKKWDTMDEDMGDALRSDDSLRFQTEGSSAPTLPLAGAQIGLRRRDEELEWA